MQNKTSRLSFAVYCSTKSATIQFSCALGTDFHLNKAKVNVITVCPGSIETALRCLKKMGTSF